jgi:hypothetical protein
MRTAEELEQVYAALPPRGPVGEVRLIVARAGEGAHELPPRARVDLDGGLAGDRWVMTRGAKRDAQITLISTDVARLVAGGVVPEHLSGDNFHVDIDLGLAALPVGARVRLGGALLEVTAKPHAGCKKFSARFGPEALRWVNDPRHAARRLRGVNCRVVEGGEVAVGDRVAVV